MINEPTQFGNRRDGMLGPEINPDDCLLSDLVGDYKKTGMEKYVAERSNSFIRKPF